MQLNISTAYKQQIGILAKDGSYFLQPQACKDYVQDAFCTLLYPEYSMLYSIWAPHIAKNTEDAKKPDANAPRLIFFSGKKSREKNAEKFQSIMNELEDRIGTVDDRTSVDVPDKDGVCNNSGPFIATMPSFWLRSPVLVSAYCTFLRLSIRMKVKENLDDFVERMMDREQANHVDGGYLRCAVKRNNLKGLIDGELPCMHREGYSDYLLNTRGRGFAWYDSQSDGTFPLDEETLKLMRIRGKKMQMEQTSDVS